VRHAQFVHCSNGVFKTGSWLSAIFTLENVLFYDVKMVRVGVCFLSAKNLTVRKCDYVMRDPDHSSSGSIDNSLIDIDSTWGDTSATINNTADDLDDSYFQTVGAAAHYLQANSLLRNAGSTNGFSATLLADLKKRTTYPPIVLTNLVIQNQDIYLAPQAQRDSDALDLGYHYDPLDYVAVGNYVDNSIISLAAGTALGLCATSINYSISLLNGGRLVTDGSPTNLTRIVRYNCSQEQANTNWTGSSPALQLGSYSGTTSADMRFTEWVIPGTTNFTQISAYCSGPSSLALSDCQLHAGKFEFLHTLVSANNCLLDRSSVIIDENFCFDLALDPQIRNCTFNGGHLYLYNFWGGIWGFTNNLFAGTSISTNGPNNIAADYNGYTTNVTRLNVGGSHDVTNLVFTFDSGALGRFYIPTNGAGSNLLNRGSTTANLLGLYHYTTSTNHVKETNSTVDIGWHYVALNGTIVGSVPIDTDGDGVPDYWEDANGDGALGHRETKPNDADDRGLRVFITRPRSGNNIP